MREAILAYLHHLQFERRVTPATLKNYRSSLTRFAGWLGERTFSEREVAAYLSTFSHAASANVVGVRLRGLARFMKRPLDIVRAKEDLKPVEALSGAELRSLIAASRNIDPTLTPVITFLAETGLRFSEYCGLSAEDMKRRGNVAWIEVYGKGRKLRKVPLSADALAAFARMPRRPGGSMQERIRRHLKRAGRYAKLDVRVHPHLLRATFISHQLNDRKSEAVKVAKIVGHSGLSTMLRHYYHESIEDLHALVN